MGGGGRHPQGTPSRSLLTVPLVPARRVQKCLAVVQQELVLRVWRCPQQQGQQSPAVDHPAGGSGGVRAAGQGPWDHYPIPWLRAASPLQKSPSAQSSLMSGAFASGCCPPPPPTLIMNAESRRRDIHPHVCVVAMPTWASSQPASCASPRTPPPGRERCPFPPSAGRTRSTISSTLRTLSASHGPSPSRPGASWGFHAVPRFHAKPSDSDWQPQARTPRSPETCAPATGCDTRLRFFATRPPPSTWRSCA